MDMNVETNVFLEIRLSLNHSKMQLLNASSDVKNAIITASNSLEGDQFSLAVSTTEQTCDILDRTESNIDRLQDYINRLEVDVNTYLNCKYYG